MILITGGTGLIGSKLSSKLLSQGHEVVILSTRKDTNHSYWNPTKNIFDQSLIERTEYIVHLAGANIASGRWTRERKKLLSESRCESIDFLFKQFKHANHKLKSVVSSSAIGYYGSATTEKIHTENEANANDFLGKMSKDWEDAALQFESIGVRTSIIRTGIVLSKEGGALSKMIPLTKLGLGAPQGSGKQYMPWIHIDDLCTLYSSALFNPKFSGAYNGVAPEHVTNAEFNKHLAHSLGSRIYLPPIPTFILRLMLGEMSQIITEGSRVSAEKNLKISLGYQHLTLSSALKHLFNN